jgi:hypothetical protein
MAGRALAIDPKKTPTKEPDNVVRATVTENENAIAARAYEFWQQRGCPVGSDQEDWFRAKAELEGQPAKTSSAAKG